MMAAMVLPTLGAIEELEVYFYQTVEFVGYFLSCP